MQRPFQFETVLSQLLEQVRPVEEEILPLEDCLGRIAAREITAARAMPPFARSPYDGYAFRAADTQGASERDPVTLALTEEIPAGTEGHCPLAEGRAAKVLTGAKLPPGADAVARFEDTRFTLQTVTLLRPYAPGENVIYPGEDVREGETLARAGTALDPALLGTLAGQGMERLWVRRVPLVGLLTIGGELTPPGETPRGGCIPDTNRITFPAAVRRAGCECRFFGSPGDDEGEIARALDAALSACDLVMTTGGVSVGDYDRTPAAARRAGAELLFYDLPLKPGGKSWFGVREGKLLGCLSGNPASALTIFYAVVGPLLHRLRGGEPRWRCARARLEAAFPKPARQTRLLRGTLVFGADGALWFRPSPRQSNAALSGMAQCAALAVLPAGSPPLPEGSWVDLLLTD